jgi:hypothetical protein
MGHVFSRDYLLKSILNERFAFSVKSFEHIVIFHIDIQELIHREELQEVSD